MLRKVRERGSLTDAQGTKDIITLADRFGVYSIEQGDGTVIEEKGERFYLEPTDWFICNMELDTWHHTTDEEFQNDYVMELYQVAFND